MKALIIVDPQNDFCEGGSLAVPDSNAIFPIINDLKGQKDFFKACFITKDWHPADHISFAANHKLAPFQEIQVSYGKQMLWPTHCVQDSHGAAPSPLLKIDETEITILKGMDKTEDNYSGFGTKKNPTEIVNKLRELEIQETFVVGLALDYCVGETALDSARNGFKTIVIAEGTRPVNKETGEAKVKELEQAGVIYTSIEKLKF